MCTNSSGDGGLWFEPSYGNFQTCVVCMCGVCGMCGVCMFWIVADMVTSNKPLP